MPEQPNLFGEAWIEESTEMTAEKMQYLMDRQKSALDERMTLIQAEPHDLPIGPIQIENARACLEIIAGDDYDPFESTETDEARQAALDRIEARKAGIKLDKSGEVGFRAFTPVGRTVNDMLDDYAKYGDAEKTGGKAKRKTVNDRPLVEAFLKGLWPECLEVRYEETWITTFSGMRVKKDRDGFIDFSVQFVDKGEILIQATTPKQESSHIKKLAIRGRKAGDNCNRRLKAGTKVYMVLCDDAPGTKGIRYNWQKIGRYQRVACIYEITLEMLQENRDRRAKLEAGKAARMKGRKL